MGEELGCKFADEVIVISNVIKDLIAMKHGRWDHVHLVYNGVPEPELCDYPEYFEELGIEKGKYVIGMCRFVPEKNLHHLVDAFAMVKPKGCKLVLAGDADFEDDYSRHLKESAQKNGVVLTGFVKGRKLHSLLTNARCYVLPSSHEGLPIALLEAMSYHLPVIVSDIPANLEVELPDECYFHLGDINALARKLQKNIDADYHQVEYDLSKYNWDHIANQVCEIYESLGK
jgi:glycosyltransferase involved in cell wall biosynthesis